MVKEYWVNTEVTIRKIAAFGGDSFTLPEHSFVKPIWNTKFVPQHVRNEWYLSEDEVFCYTMFGILPIPAKYLDVAEYY